jgi:hypothetical protein
MLSVTLTREQWSLLCAAAENEAAYMERYDTDWPAADKARRATALHAAVAVIAAALHPDRED